MLNIQIQVVHREWCSLHECCHHCHTTPITNSHQLNKLDVTVLLLMMICVHAVRFEGYRMPLLSVSLEAVAEEKEKIARNLAFSCSTSLSKSSPSTFIFRPLPFSSIPQRSLSSFIFRPLPSSAVPQ